jgi:subfamily B ATP-binding cassette protein MsbA
LKQIREILDLVRAYRGRQAAYLILNALASIFSLFSIAAIVPFLKVIFQGDQLEAVEIHKFSWNPNDILLWVDTSLKTFIANQGQLYSLYFFSGAIIVLFLLKNLFNYLSFFNIAYTRSAVVRDLRKVFYEKILALPISYYTDERKGDITSRITNDVKEIEWGVVGAIEMVFKHPVYILFYLISLFLLSWQLTLFSMIILPVSGYLISRLGKTLKSTAKKSQERLGEVLNVVEESLTGVKVIKSFGAENQLKGIFNKANDLYFRLLVKVHRKELAASPISEFLGSIVISLILIVGGRLVLSNEVALTGDFFIGYILVFSQLISPAKALSEAFFRVQKAHASYGRVREVLDADLVVHEDKDALSLDKFETDIRYDHVDFAYAEERVLKDISFILPKGKTVALVGPSGGGKSTIADLLPRFHDVKAGRIMIDGLDIREANLKSIRQLMGIVGQQPILFNASVLDNIRLGSPTSTLEEVERAAKIANAHDFIKNMEGGYNANIGDGGSKLSGGQKQRLAIARAVLNNPAILILDEATSALDTESEKLVQDALKNLMVGRTTLVIAHRLSTITYADEILVLEKGEIVERGNHRELYEKGGKYKHLVELQGI